MENLKLRKAIAEANGCKAVIRKPCDGLLSNLYVFCECPTRENSHSEWVAGKLLVKPYELDDAAALAALKEFCEKKNVEWEIRDRVLEKRRYNCTIWQIRPDLALLGDSYSDDLALAICEAIKSAAEGR